MDLNDRNELEKELEDIKEWQDNQYNPGHYIGTGRVPRPVIRLAKYPIILVIIGVMGAVPSLLGIILQGFSFISIVFVLLFGILIYGGVRRIIMTRK